MFIQPQGQQSTFILRAINYPHYNIYSIINIYIVTTNIMSEIPKQTTQPINLSPVQSDITSSSSQSPLLPQPSPKSTPETQLTQLWQQMVQTTDGQLFCNSVKQYCLLMLNSGDEDVFMNFFVESKFLSMLRNKIKQHRNTPELPRTVFSMFQYLLKALKKDEQLVYFLLRISQEGFITEDYHFQQQEDEAYYANFLKLMIRKINEDTKYLTVFFNNRQPHFPLLLQLLKLHSCKDTIMLTSSKLAILQISNNSSALVQAYINNFPFVMLYPLYVGQILQYLQNVIQDDNPVNVDTLQSSLKYMEDFVQGKDRNVVNMYTNAFLAIVGQQVYEELTHYQQKNIHKAVRIMKILLKYVLPQIGVHKIRIGLLCLFAPLITVKMQKCFCSPVSALQSKYWLPQSCPQQVVTHCKSIFYNQQPVNKSFLKSINSYIPRSKDNWLYHQIKKISDSIGYQIVMNQPVMTQNCITGCFLDALWTMIDDQRCNNQVFTTLLKMKNQELLYYYLRILNQLCQVQQAQNLIDFEQLAQTMTHCTSVALLQVFHNLTVKSKVRVNDTEYMLQIYTKVTQKLVHFVMTKGWNQLFIRIRQSRLPHNDQAFSADIYRQIQCEILLFVSLRTLLGSPNAQCEEFKPQRWLEYPPQVVQTIFKSYEERQYGPLVYMILDGQYLNLKSFQEKLINKEELQVTDLRIYEQGNMLSICVNPKKGTFYVNLFLPPQLRQYLLKEVAKRRQMADRIALALKFLKFQFTHDS